MSNSCRLLNYIDPEGEFLRFYTELDTNFEVGDKCFIVGGNYDNTIYTDKNNSAYNPFNPYAAGYTVISVDKTATSNAVTLNISFTDAKFNSGGIQTLIFDPKPVYKTQDELIINPNQVREAYISKTYFKRGEFNGGSFIDGIFGEYNIKGVSSNKTYQRQHFVDLLRAKAVASEDLVTVNAIDSFDYSTLESPSSNNKAFFNNNFTNEPATWKGGVFLGGEFQWGSWDTKYSSTQSGKKQTLNENFGIKSLLDNSKFNIQSFNDNNNGIGYNIFMSGNFGRIYNNTHNISFDVVNNSIIFDFLPYPVKLASENGFELQLIVKSIKNNRVFDVVSDGTNTMMLNSIQTYGMLNNLGDFTIEQELYTEASGNYQVEFYIKNNNRKPLSFNTGEVCSAHWFGGVFDNAKFTGGDWHWGEFRTGTLSSLYQRTNWLNGIFNGAVDQSFAENVRWLNGNWLNGNWKGDNVVSVKNITYTTGLINIDISTIYKHLFEIGNETFISYFKKGLTNSYIDNFTDIPNDFILNFQSFTLIDIIENDSDISNFKVTLVLEGNLNSDILSDINLQNAKISQSYFQKGLWNNGIWESGLREVSNYDILSYDAGTNFLSQKQMQVTLSNTNNLSVGDNIQLSNLNLVREINIEYLDGVIVSSNRNEQEFLQSLDLTLTVINIDSTSGEILLKFPLNSTTGNIDLPPISSDVSWNLNDQLIRIDLIDSQTGKTELASCLWNSGEFRSGVWRGGLWKSGTVNNILYFDNTNTQIQSVWQNGYWKSGTWNNATFLSGVWQSGVWKNGIMSNLFGNVTINNSSGWSVGDSVWLDGTFENGTWRRGLFKNGTVLNGTIINGGLESIDWKKGQYTNGFGVFQNTNNLNRSGRFVEGNNVYDLLSAPSLIYIDSNGWVQLDQPSFYQKDYNIIFQDLDFHGDNPYNNQMFNIINRDAYGSRLLIDTDANTSGDNPLTRTFKLPILAIDNMVDSVEIASTSGNLIWIADSGNNRIMEVNSSSGQVDVLGKIIGDSSKDKFSFTNIKFMFKGTIWIYVVDGTNVKLIDSNKNNIVTLTPGLILGENIIDIWVAQQNNILNEVVFLLTDQGNLYYWMPTWTSFKVENIINYIVNTPLSFTGIRTTISTRVNIIANTITNGLSNLKYIILDFSISNQQYTITSTTDINITFKNDIVEDTTTMKIEQVVAKDNTTDFKIWLLASKYTDSTQNIYLADYDFTNNIILLPAEKLNENILDFPVARMRLGINEDHLTIIGKKDGFNTYFSTAKISKTVIGLGDPSSTIKLLDIYQNVSASTSGLSYWIYDDSPKSKRVVYIRENSDLTQLYNSDLINSVEANVEVIKLLPGESTNKVYAIIKRGTEYKIRSIDNSQPDNNNSFENNSSLTTFIKIYDGIFIKDRIYIIGDTGSGNKLYTLDTVSLTVSAPLAGLPTYTGTDFLLDGVEVVSDTYLYLWEKDSSEKIHEVKISGSNTSTNLQFNSLIGVNDICVAKTTNYFNLNQTYIHLFIAFDTKVTMALSDKTVSGHFTWTEHTNDIVYNGIGIEEIYKNAFSNIVVRYGTQFDIFDVEYTTTNKKVEDAVYFGTSFYAISNNMIINYSTSGDTYQNIQGIYHQVSRPEIFSGTPLNNNDYILANPKSIIYGSNYDSTSGFIFFIDNFTTANYNVLRSVNTSTLTKSIQYGADLTKDFLDISYNNTNKNVYCLYNDLFSSTLKLGHFSNSSSLTNFSISLTGYTKISVMEESSIVYVILLKVVGNLSTLKVYNATANTSYDITIAGTTTVNDSIKDISFTINPSSVTNKYQIFYIDSSNLLNLISTNNISSGTWTKKSLGIKTTAINERLDTNDLIIIDGSQTVSFINTTGDYSEERLSVKDMAFVDLSGGNNIFFYNTPQIGNNGVTREIVPSSLTDGIDLSIVSQINDDINATNFKKLVAIDNNLVYALFDNGIYEYNFTTNIVSLLPQAAVEYRNLSDQTPSSINNFYFHKAVDITMLNGKLIALFEIIDNSLGGNTPSKNYNAYEYSSGSFVRTDLEYLYYNLNDSINSNGNSNSIIYPPTATGGIRYLFTSYIDPKIYGKNNISSNYIYLYFQETLLGSPIFLKVIPNASIQIIDNSIFSDIVVKVELSDEFNKTTGETPNIAYISPNPLGGTTPLASTSFMDTYNTLTSSYNEFFVIFSKPIGQTFDNVSSSYNVSINFSSSVATIPPTPVSVYDFKVYTDESGPNDQIVIRENSTSTPFNVNIDNLWYLNKLQVGKWLVDNTDPLADDLEIRSLIQANGDGEVDLITIITNNNFKKLNAINIPTLDKSYNFSILIKGYKVINSLGTQILTPYITSRILYNTIISGNVQFNTNGSIYSSHLVSSRWNSGLFVGTWDAPFYFDHKIIDKYSVFINGTFQGNFYDGFFLGGTFVNKSSTIKSTLFQGHFISDSAKIDWQSGMIQSDFRYDIQDITWINNQLKLQVQGLSFDGDNYTPTSITKIVPGTLIQIPTLFKNIEYQIYEISRGKINIVDGLDEIIIKIDKPEYYSSEFWIGNKIFISATEFVEYLFGEYDVKYSYTQDNFLFLIINSTFNNFDSNGLYIPIIKPKIIIGVYNRIVGKTDFDNGVSEIILNLPVPNTVSISNTYSDKLKLVQQYYISEHIDILTEGDYIGSFIIPNYLQAFSFTFTKSYNDVTLKLNSVANNLYLNNIISISNSSYVNVDLANFTPAKFATDIMVNNSYITSTNVNNWLESSIFLSGKTDRKWVTGAWLNLDDKGFANGQSQFGDSSNMQTFDGNPTKILGMFFESIDFIWIELDSPILNVDKHRYITLRGFTGNKSNIIGSTRSKVFRIAEVDDYWIKIANPFKYYKGLNAVSTTPYLKDFNADELFTQKQNMNLKYLTSNNISVGIENNSTNGTSFTFEYGYASVTAWNGGDFYGNFNSVWNAGNFRAGNFNGQWFGTPESYNWQGNVKLSVTDLSNKFLLSITGINGVVLDKDLVYVKLNSSFINGTIIETFPGFYSEVKLDGTSGNLIIEYLSDTTIKEGNYPINIIRYRTDSKDYNDINNLVNNNLIVDYNVNLAPNDNVNTHTWLDKNIASTSGGLVIQFNGANSIATIDLISEALHTGESDEFSIDLAFKYTNIVDTKIPILGFHNTKTLNLTGFKIYIKNNDMFLEYQKNGEPVELELTTTLGTLTVGWNQLSLFINKNSGVNSLKYIINTYNSNIQSTNKDISDWDSFNENVAYDLNFIGENVYKVSGLSTVEFYHGYLDEIRFWNKDMYQFFLSPYTFQTKRFINNYIPEIIAYFSGDGNILTLGKLYPVEENFFVFDDINTKIDTLPYFKVNNAVYEMDILVGKNPVANTFKLFAIEEERYSGFRYNVEFFGSDNGTNATPDTESFSIKVKESISYFGSTLKENYHYIPATVNYWNWYNMILTENGIYLNGTKIDNSAINFKNKNIFKHTINVRLNLGDSSYLYGDYKTDINLTPVSYMRGFIKGINIWENNNTKEDYIIYRIISPEDIGNFAVTNAGTNGTGGNTIINNVNSSTSSNIVIPYFNSDGSLDWEHYIYTTENYFTSSTSGDLITYNKSLSDNGSIIPSDSFDSNLKFIKTDLLSNALPTTTNWLDGTDFVSLTSFTSFVDDFNLPITVTGMDNFKIFGSKYANTSGQINMKISSNGFLTIFDDPSVNTYISTSNIVDIPSNNLLWEQISSIDAIYVLFSDLTYSTNNGGYVQYANRANELVIKFYTMNSRDRIQDPTLKPSNFEYVALRIDKINSSILFYNRRIKASTLTQKIQGIRRSDTTWNYINDPYRFSYYKYKNNISDFVLGYDTDVTNLNTPIKYNDDNIKYVSKNTEYVLYIPRSITYDDNNFIPKIITKDYDYLKSELNINIITNYNRSKLSGTPYPYIFDSSRIIPDYYVTSSIESTSGYTPYNGTNFLPFVYEINEQYSPSKKDFNITRESFFYNGNFNSKIWHNGIFVNGNIITDGLTPTIWKYGLKYNGNISNNSIIPINTHLHWLGGFHLGSDNINSTVHNIIWYRGYWKGGRWNGGNWLSINQTNDYITGFTSNNNWSTWDGGEWYSINNSTSGSNEYALSYQDSNWHGGTWNSSVITNGSYTASYTYQSNEFKFYTMNNNKQIELPIVNSIWLGGQWLRGEWNGGIFVNGFWHSVNSSLANGTNGSYENKVSYKYNSTFSSWSAGMMLNSIWEGGTVQDSGNVLDTVFGDINNFDQLNVGTDFIWDSTAFPFKRNILENLNITTMGKKLFNFVEANPTLPSISPTNDKNRVLNQFNSDGVYSVYWRRGDWKNGIFQFSYWENKDLNNLDNINISVSSFNSHYERGVFYSSYWKGGLWENNASGNSVNTLNTTVPNSVFYRSTWEKGYWKADGLDASTSGTSDGIKITDGIFSRSLWNAGVWEGGLFDLSVLRSGVSSLTIMNYKGTSLALTAYDSGNNFTLAVSSPSAPTTLPEPSAVNFTNNSSFITNINSSGLRYVGGVDNLSTIWVNGWMRGSVVHGGIWQRGMFSHKHISTTDSFDFFDDNEVNKNEIGIWVRGLWLSGYFSYYNDYNIVGQSPSYGTSKNYLNSSNGTRCLFMGIKATKYTSISDWDRTTSLGISKPKLDTELASATLDSLNHNYASIFCRSMIKGSKRYFTIFNGTFINGSIFDNSTNVSLTNRSIVSIFSTIGKYHYNVTNSNPLGDNATITSKLTSSIKLAQSIKLINYTIIYNNSVSPIYYNGSSWVRIDDNTPAENYLEQLYNGGYYSNSIDWTKSIWRHDQTTVGDDTITSSIAQGVGYKWNTDQPQPNDGEPDYTGIGGTNIP